MVEVNQVMRSDSTTVLLHDHGLAGEKGALQVLRRLEENQLCERVVVSHNSLGDRGVQGMSALSHELGSI